MNSTVEAKPSSVTTLSADLMGAPSCCCGGAASPIWAITWSTGNTPMLLCNSHKNRFHQKLEKAAAVVKIREIG